MMCEIVTKVPSILIFVDFLSLPHLYHFLNNNKHSRNLFFFFFFFLVKEKRSVWNNPIYLKAVFYRLLSCSAESLVALIEFLLLITKRTESTHLIHYC